ncbi:hypothetical protein AALD22_22935 [Lachnospiraceae bacterium 56-18]
MTAEHEFYLYLLECYAAYKNKPTGEVLEEWDLLNISDFIFNKRGGGVNSPQLAA